MVKTYCKHCVFNNVEEKDCWFGIPSLLENKKNLSKKDGYFLIEDYQCMYGSNLSNNTDISLSFQDILSFAINKNLLRYYLFLDLTAVSNVSLYIENLIPLLNGIDNFPRFVSLLTFYDKQNADCAKYIEKNISQNIKWKIHNIKPGTEPEQNVYINVSTNIGANYTSSLMFCKASEDVNADIDKIKNQTALVHMSQIVLQERAHLFMRNIEDLDGLFIPNIIYKELIAYGEKNIVSTIKKINEKDKDLQIVFYDYKKNT